MKPFCITCLLLLAAWPVAGRASMPDFDRYQIILDRKPFGDVPPAPETPPPAPGPAAPPWADSYRLVSVTQVEGGDVRVGILDRRNNKALVLRIGEMQEGIELLEADVGEESAQLRKDGETATMNLQGATSGERPSPPPATPAQATRPQTVRPTIRPGARPPPAGQVAPTRPMRATQPTPPGVIRPGMPSPQTSE